MIKISNTETYGWEAAIRGMRNPMNSWDKSDSAFSTGLSTYNILNKKVDPVKGSIVDSGSCIGPADQNLMLRLANSGTDHRKFMRMIAVYCDVTAPLYWWKEFDTYKVGTVANSCSTMHKIQAKEFTIDDFSHEHLGDIRFHVDKDDWYLTCMQNTISMLNDARDGYLKTKDKKYWWSMIQLLPSSYNQKRTVMMNYEVLANIYKSRRNHKLEEWHDFCDWIEKLPYSKLITGEE